MGNVEYSNLVKQLVDDLKGVFTSAGLGGEAGEYKLLIQSFLYKFINDKFLYEAKKFNSRFDYQTLMEMSDDDYEGLQVGLGNLSAEIKREDLIESLFNRQNEDDFSVLFDATLNDIAVDNNDIYSVETAGNTEVRLFDSNLLEDNILDASQRNNVARSIINKLSEIKFDEHIFSAGFDFFSTIFEYMIKDYNKDGGGKYAEYYTPHSVAKIIAQILVGEDKPENVRIYDPAAGSGTLLMTLAGKIDTQNATVYSQDISQKSTNLLRLNLILNGLSHSIRNIVQGNTILNNKHPEKMDYIISNPPFNLDFSEWRDQVDTTDNNSRFFAGVPAVPKKKKSSMSIYLLFLQHIIWSLCDKGKAAIVVPSGFLTDSGSIETKIRNNILENKWLRAVIQMPTNVFANTNTSVSVIFLDKETLHEEICFVDATKLCLTEKVRGKAKTVLQDEDSEKIIQTITNKKSIPEFSVVVDHKKVLQNDGLIKPGLYFAMRYHKLSLLNRPVNHEVEKAEQKIRSIKNDVKRTVEANLLLEWFVDLNYSGFSGEQYESEFGRLPVELKLVPLSELLDQLITGDWGEESIKGNYTERVRCIRGTDMPQIAIANYEKVPTRYILQSHTHDRLLKENDIVLEISGGSKVQSTGRICLITRDVLQDLGGKVVCSNFCKVLRLDKNINAEFVYTYLKLLYSKGYFFNLENNTTGIKNLIIKSFVDLKIPVPNDSIMDDFSRELDLRFESLGL